MATMSVISFTGVDTDRNGKLITQHKVFMSRWARTNIGPAGNAPMLKVARAAGVNLAFLVVTKSSGRRAGNQASMAQITPYRTLVCYKESDQNHPFDPADPPTWTGMWRDRRFSPPADGGRPEKRIERNHFPSKRVSQRPHLSASGRWENALLAKYQHCRTRAGSDR